ncbi:MAG: hypothetical protein GDA37_10195 [Ekhidna sp.]|nr:hypothetical protein [Ekhidna sp.]
MKNITLIFILFVFSCQSDKRSEVAELKNVVIAIHDEVMPKIGELRRIRRDLMLQADSLKMSDSTGSAALLIAADEIASANEGMMDWMRNYDPEFEGSDEEVKAYFEDQKIAIQKVKKNMESSLADGKRVAAMYKIK